jgi:hypothetical protein
MRHDQGDDHPMKRIRVLAAVAALGLAGTVAAPAAHGATSPAASSSAHPSGLAISGAVYYYSGINYGNLCDTTNLLKHTYGPCANTDLSLFNDVPGYRVRFFYGANEQGAWICLDYGQAVTNAPLVFDQGAGRAGYRQTIWDNVHSEELVPGAAGCNPDELSPP